MILSRGGATRAKRFCLGLYLPLGIALALRFLASPLHGYGRCRLLSKLWTFSWPCLGLFSSVVHSLPRQNHWFCRPPSLSPQTSRGAGLPQKKRRESGQKYTLNAPHTLTGTGKGHTSPCLATPISCCEFVLRRIAAMPRTKVRPPPRLILLDRHIRITETDQLHLIALLG